MNEVLTRAEMEAQFDGEWVLVADPEVDDSHEVQRGRVIHHSMDREAIYDHEESLHSQSLVHVYLGKMPKRILLNDWLTMGAAIEHTS